MSTSSTSLASLASQITAPQTTSTSTSTFSADLQAAVTRAIQIASLPIQQLTQDQANTNNQITELSTLTSDFTAVQSALQSLSVLDITALKPAQINHAVKIFDDICHNELLPFHQIDSDKVREELDERFFREVLRLPAKLSQSGGPLDLLRMKLAREPSVRGQK